ncbi:MAG: dephospho-CoA kinase [Lachnospiraceae bacterium]|nr:dephospho-CoA kinase [Lachnospiraceae bacterium]
MRELRFIGITGGVGAGKSEILKYIAKHYMCEIYLADEVAKEVQRSGTECFCRLLRLMGEKVIGEDGELARGKVAELIFADSGMREQVNAIVHPAVKDYLLERLESAKRNPKVELFFVEAALLIETGYGELVDEMWYIYASDTIRSRRLREARGYDEEKSRRIMASQLSEDEFRKASSFVIDNSGLLTDTYQQIDKKLEAFTWQE